LVYRAVLAKKHIDPETGGVLSGAFLLRQREKEDGSIEREVALSVFIATERQPDELGTTGFNKCYGLTQLEVRAIRELGPKLGLQIDVVRDLSEEAPPGHALITGVPHPSEDPARAERLASLLAELANGFVWRRASR
jgi:hypothetical protein